MHDMTAEQQRAFAQYMGTGTQALTRKQPALQAQGQSSASAQAQFYPLGVPPTAPTPPSAAPSVASGNPYSGYFDQQQQQQQQQYPPPLSSAAGQLGGQLGGWPGFAVGQNYHQASVPPNIHASAYTGYPTNNPPNQGVHNPWAYGHPMPLIAATPTMTRQAPHASRSPHLVSSLSKEQQQYYRYDSPAPDMIFGPPPPGEMQRSVLLCHTCSECGQVRSASYHRMNPVVPGQTDESTPCARCAKRMRRMRARSSTYSRTRTCVADEPCEWPAEDFVVKVDREERRGRERRRDNVTMRSRSLSGDRVYHRRQSRSRMGLRALQNDESDPPQVIRRSSTVRVRHESPPPIIVREKVKYTGAWPPPDLEQPVMSPPPRPSSRVVELPPTPPPPLPAQPQAMRRTRFIYEHESDGDPQRPRSLTPPAVRMQRHEAEIRIATDPNVYRSTRCQAPFVEKLKDDSSTDCLPARSILKSGSMQCEPSRRDMNSFDGDIGGPRVQFVDRDPNDAIEYRYVERRQVVTPPPPQRPEPEYRRRSPSPQNYREVRVRAQSPGPAKYDIRYRYHSPPPGNRSRDPPALPARPHSPLPARYRQQQRSQVREMDDATDTASERSDQRSRGRELEGRPPVVEQRRVKYLLEEDNQRGGFEFKQELPVRGRREREPSYA